jgi:signal transduction histidine kinase
VSITNRFSTTRSRFRLPRRTVRLRLTVLYSLLFIAAGAGLLAITYLSVRSATNIPPSKPLHSISVGNGLIFKSGTKSTPQQLELKEEKQKALKAQALAENAIDMHALLVWSGIALAIMAMLAVALGWLVAGRVLRPLRTMTTATRRITEHSLHERLALEGPSDELKDLGDTIDGLLHRLEAAFDAQRQFATNASHELRTPLTLNRAILEVTLADPDATVDELRAMGQELIASGEQQEQLIEALLTLATSARGLERHEPFDLSEIAADVLRGPHPEIDQLGLDVQTRITPAPAIGDPRLAQRLVANLFDNALRHNVAGGYIQIATTVTDGNAILSVTNTGPVILVSEMDRLFDPFQRLDPGRTNHKDGHGIGLSIVRAIAAAHSATITAHPRSEGGLSVEVSFPRPTNGDSAPVTGSGAHRPSQRPAHGRRETFKADVQLEQPTIAWPQLNDRL